MSQTTRKAPNDPESKKKPVFEFSRAVISSSGPKLHLADELKKPDKDLQISGRTLADIERNYIILVSEQVKWKVGGNNSAAEMLGLNRSTLSARMRKLNIRKP